MSGTTLKNVFKMTMKARFGLVFFLTIFLVLLGATIFLYFETIRIVRPQHPEGIHLLQYHFRVSFLKALFWGVAIAYFCAHYLSRVVTGPIGRLGEKIDEIARTADLSKRVGLKADPEIAAIAGQFNRLIERLEENRDRLAEERNRYYGLFEHSPGLYFGLSGTLELTRVNRTFLAATGYDKRDAVGRNIAELLPEANRENILEILRSPGKVAKSSFEMCLLSAKNRPLYLSLMAQRAPADASGTAVNCLGIDITVARELEKNYVQEDKMAKLGRVIAGLAHEFRNPLAGAILNVNLELSGNDAGEKTKERLRTIRGDLERLNSLVRQTLDFSRRDSHAVERVGLPEVIEKSVTFIRKACSEKAIRLELAIAPDLPKLLINPTEIEHVILNIAINAIEAMKADGVLSIAAFVFANRTHLTIADTGPGIPADEIDKVFEPFFTTKTDGIGLGLSLCQSLVLKNHGKIEARNGERGGAVFDIAFLNRIGEN